MPQRPRQHDDGRDTMTTPQPARTCIRRLFASSPKVTPSSSSDAADNKETYGDRGFTVLGFPSNQFLQEPGSSEAIQEFCSTTYGVTFPMFEKIRVNGRSQHPLYIELTKTPDASGKAGKVKWNFEKFIVTPAGEVHRFRPTVEPDAPEILDLIESSLPPAGWPTIAAM